MAARQGCEVVLYEMRPVRQTRRTRRRTLAELVCSNSLKSESENTAPWLLKQEMRRAGSVLLRLADECAVPAGHALAVDRAEFSRRIGEAIEREPRITVVREEVTRLDDFDGLTIVASGPLTSPCAFERDCAAYRVRSIWRFTTRSRRLWMRTRLTVSGCTWRRAGTRARRITSTAR